jgi:uncharacterized protein (TIGR00297 family)
MSLRNQSVDPLRWQSQILLVLVVAPVAATFILRCTLQFGSAPNASLALAFGVGLALLTWRLRAATPGASLCGGLFAAALYLATPGWRTALWPLLALLLLTLAATRFGRAQKEKLGVAEASHGRNAAQVTANLGAATLSAILLGLPSSRSALFSSQALRMALVAALAEAAADTLSSELGEVLGGEPRLLTTLRRIPAGTDGAISLAGTLAGLAAAIIVAAVASFALSLMLAQAILVVLAAVAGLFIDSWLGAVLERRGWLNNDAVNFLSTLAASLFALAIAARW